MSEVKKKAYLVIKPNTLKYDVGDTVELTDLQASTLINKVRLKDSIDTDASKAGRKSKLESDNKELVARVTELEASNKALLAENQQLKAPKA